MTIFTFANNVNTTLASPISPSSTSLTLSSSANLPASIPAGQSLVITLNDQATRKNFEVIYATSVSGATLSGLSRAQEGTSALSWLASDFAYSGTTAGQMESFGQAYQILGIGQSFTNVTGSRSYNTTYTNTESQPIMIHAVGLSSAAATSVGLFIAGEEGQNVVSQGASQNLGISAIIPPRLSYGLFTSGGTVTLISWFEYR